MATPKAMKLLDPYTGLMECKHCGYRHQAQLRSGGHYYRGSWQCGNPVCPSKQTTFEQHSLAQQSKAQRSGA